MEVKEKVINLADLALSYSEVAEKLSSLNIPFYLTGGTAARLYSKTDNREMSFDLDFILPSYLSENQIQSVEELFGVQFMNFSKKKTFKSNKLVATSSDDCDLDLILTQRVLPDEEDPDMEILAFMDSEVESSCREVQFENSTAQAVPPEFVVLTKVFAGRDIKDGKYDFVDSLGILENASNNGFSITNFVHFINKFSVNKSGEQRVKVRIRKNLFRLIELTQDQDIIKLVTALINAVQ